MTDFSPGRVLVIAKTDNLLAFMSGGFCVERLLKFGKADVGTLALQFLINEGWTGRDYSMIQKGI